MHPSVRTGEVELRPIALLLEEHTHYIPVRLFDVSNFRLLFRRDSSADLTTGSVNIIHRHLKGLLFVGRGGDIMAFNLCEPRDYPY